MNVSLVHPAPQDSLWIELYDKNTLVSIIIIIMDILYIINLINELTQLHNLPLIDF